MVTGRLGLGRTYYKPEYEINYKGQRQRFKTDKKGRFILASGDTLSNDQALLQGITYQQLLHTYYYKI